MKIERQEKKTLALSLLTVLLTICVIIYSEEAFPAALEGLQVWWEVVFPSLLPFFIIAEILMGLGVVHFLGTLLEPLMRPLFKVPGVGAFALAMGLASGYPIGAKITSNLRRSEMCTKTEAERLISFTNTADPLFMIGAVAVGMFHRPDLGIILAASHYISSLGTGFFMRFYSGENKNLNKENTTSVQTGQKAEQKNIFTRAVSELLTARKNDGRNLGKLLGDSVKESINTLLMVGGFIILFSVITRILTVIGIVDLLTGAIMFILQPFNFSPDMVLPLISGLFEISNGANLVSQATAPLTEQLIVCSIIIAWSGISVHGQVATMISGTDINLKPYIIARILQSILAGIVTFVFLFSPGSQAQSVLAIYSKSPNILSVLIRMASLGAFILLILLIISLLVYVIKRIKITFIYLN